ncbi:MAG: hypothetical protein HOC74_36855 [Gemmatimonadetes bacterium]|jgi:3-hydroxy-5-methyl-1-naphthoate 3-O-methyltransferase|nr:hypothetical protein [Gemmatimonadota bacterium]
MLDARPGPDPYVFYKMFHVERARSAWIFSEEFGLYEALRPGPSTIAEVAQRIGLEERPTAVLLAANACMGIVGVEDERYFIFDIMREFVLEGGRARNKPRKPGPEEDGWYRNMEQALRTNQPVPEELPDWVTNPQGGVDIQAFGTSRHGWRILWGEALATAFDFGPFHKVADLGGATGGVLVGLTGKYPGLKGVVVDLPYSKETAEAAIRQSEADDRVSFFAADFFKEPFPAEVDVFFMSHVIHDWDDEHCLTLLRRCCDALPTGSPVIVQEYLLNEDKSGSLLGVFQWFGLMDGTTGDQRNAAEIAALMEQAGLREMESRAIDREQSIVVGWKR